MQTTVPAFDLRRQISSLRAELLQALESVTDSGYFVLGPEVAAFEQDASAFLGIEYSVGVASGTDALWLSLKAAGIGPGDFVLTSPFTFFATASAIVNAGATPIFADINPGTFNLDVGAVNETLKARTGASERLGVDPALIKGFVPIHLYGQTAPMEELMNVALGAGLTVVEDAAQAFGASLGGRHAGTFGHCGCFSFYPTKNLGGFGDGGLVATSHESVATRIRILRDHGSKLKYHHEVLGGNSRLDALQAAVLRVKLRHLESWNRAREEHAVAYDRAFASLGWVTTPARLAGSRHIYHQYTIRVPATVRDSLQAYLQNLGIGTVVYYPKPLHLQPALAHLGYREGDFPEAEKACQEVISLPMFPELSTEERGLVISAISEFGKSRGLE